MDVTIFYSYLPLGFLSLSTLVLVLFWKDYYLMFNIRLLFVIGLAFSRFLTDYAVTSVLAWYFTNYGMHIVTAAILSNFESSLSSILVIFMAHAADSYVGRFYTLLFSNTAFIFGLMLLWLFNPYDVIWLVVILLVLLSLGTSGENTLEDVLIDLVKDIDKPGDDQEEERALARAEIWLRIAYVLAAVSAILWVATDAVGGVHPSWQSTFLICIITMTITSIIFCKGHNIYHQDRLTTRPVEVFLRVLRVTIKKLLNGNSRAQSNSETDVIGNEGSTSYTQDIMVVKRLLRMFPMWAMFIVVSLISATGFTFFYEQYTNLNVSERIPIQIYGIAQDLSRFAIPFSYRWICGSHKNEKVKIGVGMLYGIISCIFAWQLELHRLKEVHRLEELGYIVDMDSNTSISFLWLMPQFIALGCMEGLTWEGVLNFYRLQVEKEPLLSYGEEYIAIVMGLGQVISIFLILISKNQLGWFGDTINDSRLDKYYFVLGCIFLVNFVFYCGVATCFYKDQALANGDQEQDNQVLANGDQKQDDQVLANGDQEQDNPLVANGDNEQDDQALLYNM